MTLRNVQIWFQNRRAKNRVIAQRAFRIVEEVREQESSHPASSDDEESDVVSSSHSEQDFRARYGASTETHSSSVDPIESIFITDLDHLFWQTDQTETFKLTANEWLGIRSGSQLFNPVGNVRPHPARPNNAPARDKVPTPAHATNPESDVPPPPLPYPQPDLGPVPPSGYVASSHYSNSQYQLLADPTAVFGAKSRKFLSSRKGDRSYPLSVEIDRDPERYRSGSYSVSASNGNGAASPETYHYHRGLPPPIPDHLHPFGRSQQQQLAAEMSRSATAAPRPHRKHVDEKGIYPSQLLPSSPAPIRSEGSTMAPFSSYEDPYASHHHYRPPSYSPPPSSNVSTTANSAEPPQPSLPQSPTRQVHNVVAHMYGHGHGRHHSLSTNVYASTNGAKLLPRQPMKHHTQQYTSSHHSGLGAAGPRRAASATIVSTPPSVTTTGVSTAPKNAIERTMSESTVSSATTGTGTGGSEGDDKDEGVNEGSQSTGEEEDDGDDGPYCFCQEKSYGLMIGCDNESDCPYQWFHVACVHVREPWPITWFCDYCTKKLGYADNTGAQPSASANKEDGRGARRRRK